MQEQMSLHQTRVWWCATESMAWLDREVSSLKLPQPRSIHYSIARAHIMNHNKEQVIYDPRGISQHLQNVIK